MKLPKTLHNCPTHGNFCRTPIYELGKITKVQKYPLDWTDWLENLSSCAQSQSK